jgi:4-amino-4-deoxy-L-arabinose transferase-like glycosyltransferase
MVAKYIYGLFLRPEAIPIRGKDVTISDDDITRIKHGTYLRTILWDKEYAVPYDFTFPRVISAFFLAFAVVFTTVLAGYVIERMWWSMLPGIFLLLTPRFVYLGQLMTFESLSVFFFCTILLLFSKLFTNPVKLRKFITLGILCGLFFWTRYNNIIIFPLLTGWLAVHYYFFKDKKIFDPRLLLIPVIAFFLGVLIWPLLWYEFPKYLLQSFSFHEHRFVGISLYYWKYFFVTTPIPVLIGACIGIYYYLKERTYWNISMLWFIICTVVIYSILVIETGGTRYVIILYPLLAITASYGYFRVLKHKYALILIALVTYMLIEQLRFFPYYLDYYNVFTGGATGAIEQGYEFSWWGEGQREANDWITKNAPAGSTVGLITSPKYVFPSMRRDLKNKENVDEKTDADFVVISRTMVPSLSKTFFHTHEVTYRASIDNEWLVEVVKKK